MPRFNRPITLMTHASNITSAALADAASIVTTAFTASVTVMISSDKAGRIAVSATGVPTATDVFLPANTPILVNVPVGQLAGFLNVSGAAAMVSITVVGT